MFSKNSQRCQNFQTFHRNGILSQHLVFLAPGTKQELSTTSASDFINQIANDNRLFLIWYGMPSIDRIEKYTVINQNNSSKHVHIAINKCFVYKTTLINNICPYNK